MNPEFVKVSNEKIRLTRLHGSLNWLIDKEKGDVRIASVQARVRKDSTRWERNEYVLFGTKAHLGTAGIYDTLFDLFEATLYEAEICEEQNPKAAYLFSCT